jgi:hypothetical protein
MLGHVVRSVLKGYVEALGATPWESEISNFKRITAWFSTIISGPNVTTAAGLFWAMNSILDQVGR